MKTLLMLSLCFFATNWLFAQGDDSIQFIHGLPVTGEDTAQPVPQTDYAPEDNMVRVHPDSIPSPIAEAWDEFAPLKNWRNETIVFDRNTELYWIRIKQDSTLRSYGYTREGHPVSIKEKSADQ